MKEPGTVWLNESDVEATDWKDSRHAGVRYRSLRFQSESGAGAMILEMAPGTSYPAHRHTQGEDVYVLSGELIIAQGDPADPADAPEAGGAPRGRRFGPGSYVYSPPGSVHAPRTESGCTMFIVLPGHVVEVD